MSRKAGSNFLTGEEKVALFERYLMETGKSDIVQSETYMGYPIGLMLAQLKSTIHKGMYRNNEVIESLKRLGLLDKKKDKLEDRMIVMKRFLDKYPVIWRNRSKNLFEDFEVLEQIRLEYDDFSNSPEYKRIFAEIVSRLGVSDIKSFEELEDIKADLEYCETTYNYLKNRKSKGLLSGDELKKLKEMGIGSAFGSEIEEIAKNNNIEMHDLRAIENHYGTIDRFREIYKKFLINKRESAELFVSGLAKNLVRDFDLSSPDLIYRKDGYKTLHDEIFMTENEWGQVLDSNLVKAQIAEAMVTLTNNERIVIDLYYDLYDRGEKYTYNKLAEELGLTHTRIGQMRESAIRKMRKNLLAKEKNNLKLTNAFVQKFFENHDVFYNLTVFDMEKETRDELRASIKEENQEKVKVEQEEKQKEALEKREKFAVEVCDKILTSISIESYDIQAQQKIKARIQEFITSKMALEDFESDNILNKKVTDMNFSHRIKTVLADMEIADIRTLINYTEEEVREFRNLGIKSHKELVEKVHSMGLAFATKESEKKREISFENNVFYYAPEEIYEIIADTLDVKSIQIKDFKLSVRSHNALRRAGISTLSDLLNISTEEVKRIEGIGEKSCDEIISKIHSMGFLFVDERQKDEVEEKLDELSEEEIDETLKDAIEGLQITYAKLKAKQGKWERLLEELKDKIMPEEKKEVREAEIRKRLEKIEKRKKQVEKSLNEWTR